MSFAGVNELAVIAAAIASFLFGGLWYGALSKPWLEAANMRPEDTVGPEGRPRWAPFVLAVLAQAVMAWFLAGMIGHLSPGQVTVWNGIVTGAAVWAGFVITTLAVNHAFQNQKPSLTLIDGGHWLGVLLIQGAIIGVFGI